MRISDWSSDVCSSDLVPSRSSTCATSSGKPVALATDLRLAYADIDQELFDVDQIPMTSRDVRSVGEMLFDVDYLARQLLMDIDGDAAGTLLRSWPTMVAAAEDLWASLPGRRPGVDERARPITRLSAQAATIETSQTGRAHV